MLSKLNISEITNMPPFLKDLDPGYLLKVVTGALLLIGLTTATLMLDASPAVFTLYSGLLMAIYLGLIPLIRFIYKSRDELLRLIHQRACVSSVSHIIALAGVAGVLQATGTLPLFNQAWWVPVLVTVWALNLMLADRHY